MKKISKTVIFFGNERLATGVTTSAPTLQKLINEGYTIAAVVSNYEKAQSRKSRRLEIQTIADEHNIPVILPTKLTDIALQLREFKATIGVLVAYGKIIPDSIINIFPHGIVNIHPSLLPKHRGPTPIESAIINGDTTTGVSIMQLSQDMDAGPVYAQSEYQPKGDTTKQLIADDLLEIGGAMLVSILPGILDGTIISKPQPNSDITYDKLIKKNDGDLEWGKPANQLEREIRAFAIWPQSRTKLANKDVIISKVHVVKESGNPGVVVLEGSSLKIFCGKDALVIDRLKPSGKAEMDIVSFIAGYGKIYNQ